MTETITCNEAEAPAILADRLSNGWRCLLQSVSEDGSTTLAFVRWGETTLVQPPRSKGADGRAAAMQRYLKGENAQSS